MKWPIAVVSMVLAAYVAGYLLVRWQFHCSSESLIPTSTGYTGPVHRELTSFWIPWGGLERPYKKGLFWLFYPAGRLDQKISGRVYERTDARVVIH